MTTPTFAPGSAAQSPRTVATYLVRKLEYAPSEGRGMPRRPYYAWYEQTHVVGLQPIGSVLVPESERLEVIDHD